jgi:hypothetical protein
MGWGGWGMGNTAEDLPCVAAEIFIPQAVAAAYPFNSFYTKANTQLHRQIICEAVCFVI